MRVVMRNRTAKMKASGREGQYDHWFWGSVKGRQCEENIVLEFESGSVELGFEVG